MLRLIDVTNLNPTVPPMVERRSAAMCANCQHLMHPVYTVATAPQLCPACSALLNEAAQVIRRRRSRWSR